jgi:hydroxypyruvate isomerase
MPRFAANLSLLYAHLPFLERIKAAKEDGFEAIECQFPYQENSGVALSEIAQLMSQLELPMVLHNLRGGDWSKEDRGLACDPARVEEFRKGVPDAISHAQHLGVQQLNCLAGILPEGVSRHQAQKTFVEDRKSVV